MFDVDNTAYEELNASKRRFLKTIAVTGGAGALSGCLGSGGENEQEPEMGGNGDSTSESSSESGEPTQGGELVQASVGEPRNLSYWQSYTYNENNITTNIWEPLLEYGEEPPYELAPALATDMSIEEPTQFIFNLREGVTFHDGTELTAEDVKASIEFVQNPESQSSLAWLFANLDSVNVMDEYTVEWVLSQSDSIMQFVPATLGAAVAPKSQIDEKGLDLGTDPVGAGPWQLEEWQSGNYIQLSRHDNYWREGRPYLDTLTFNIEPSSSSRITGLQDQSIDTVDQFPSSQAQTIEQMSHVELYQDLISFGAAFFTFNQTKEPFDNRNVRRAVSYAIDTEQMTESIKGDYGRHAYSMIPEEMEFGHVGPDDLEYDGFPYDPEQARQLLDEEGITGDPRFETAIHVPNYDDTRQAARIIQEYLAEIQIDVEINEMTEQQHIQEWFGEPPENQGPMLFGDWVSDFPDPQPLLEPLYRTGTSNNWTGYSNEEVDEYLDTVRTSLDPEERAEAAKNANQQVVDDANYLWMWHPVHMRAMNNRYEGWIHRPPFFGYWATMFGTVYDSEQ